MNRYRLLFSIILLLCFSPCLRAGEWQWSVTLDGFVSNETNRNPTAFLWIPADCMRVKTILVGQHNMSEETLFDNPLFREKMQKLGIGFVWITPGIDQQWDVSKGTQRIFEKMMADLADVSGYSELKNVPIVPIGHSAMATYPWNFAAWNAERTLAVISLHGDAPRTNLTGYGRENLEWGRTRNINGIPGLMIEGEYEWWEARVNPAQAFRMMYPESCISFLCDAGRGHFDVADETAAYIALFLEKAVSLRLTDEVTKDGKVKLNPINPPKAGWQNAGIPIRRNEPKLLSTHNIKAMCMTPSGILTVKWQKRLKHGMCKVAVRKNSIWDLNKAAVCWHTTRNSMYVYSLASIRKPMELLSI